MPRFLLVVLLAVAAVGCTGPRRVAAPDADAPSLPADFGRHSAADILARLAAGEGTHAGLAGRGRLLVTSPDENGTFDIDLRAARDGRFYLTVSALGIEGARALARPDSVFLYNRLDNTLQLGPTDRAAALLPFPLDGPAGFQLLSGLLRPASAAGVTVEADRREGVYRLRSADGRTVYSVDPTVWRVVRVVRYDAANALAEEVLTDRYEPTDALPLPARVSVRRPAARTAATLLFDRLAPTDDPNVPATLSVPSGVRRRPF